MIAHGLARRRNNLEAQAGLPWPWEAILIADRTESANYAA